MDKNKAIDLIKAKTLGCLTKEEDAEFNEYMKNATDFPGDAIGEYQNLTAMLPILLQLEVPAPELKDNVARKLYKILEELKAKKQAESKPEPEIESAKTEPEIVTEAKLDESLPEEPVKFNLGDSKLQTEPDLSSVTTEDLTEISLEEGKIDTKSITGRDEGIVDEKLERQKTLEYVNSYYKEEMNALKKANKKNKLFSIILFAILLVLLGVAYFLLSSEIGSNKEQLDKLGFNQSHTIFQENYLV